MSRTILLNGAYLLVTLGTYLQAPEFTSRHPDFVLWGSVLLAVGNLALRYMTDKPMQGILTR